MIGAWQFGELSSPAFIQDYSISEIRDTLKENFKEYEEDEDNLERAVEAIRDVQGARLYFGDNRGKQADFQILRHTLGITEELLNKGYVDFRGRRINGPADLAVERYTIFALSFNYKTAFPNAYNLFEEMLKEKIRNGQRD